MSILSKTSPSKMKRHIPYCWFETKPFATWALQNGTQNPRCHEATALGHPDILPPESLSSDMEAWLAAPWIPCGYGLWRWSLGNLVVGLQVCTQVYII